MTNMEVAASAAGGCVRRRAGLLAFVAVGIAQPSHASDADDAGNADGDVIIVAAARYTEISSAKVDTALKDIPPSIQAVPRELEQPA